MKKFILLLVALVASANVWAEIYITDVMVIGGTQTEVNTLKSTYTSQGWTVIDQDLNAGCGSGSDYIYLLYKKWGKNEAGDSTIYAADHFITDFMIDTSSGTVEDKITVDGRTYHLVPYDGGEHFKSVQGDLNSNCRTGSANIHLYYTTTNEDDRCCVVKSITFNNTQAGGVTTEDGSTGYDLNTGCGSGSAYIYMHTDKAQGWEIFMSSDHSQCYITGFDGPMAALKSVIIPLYVDNSQVIGFKEFDFTGFTNLETINFYDNTVIDWMPSMQNCYKLKQVNTLDNDGNDFNHSINMIPYSMTVIPGYGFSRTAIETIALPAVTEIRWHAFDECNHLSNVSLGSAVQIGDYAFANISSNCLVSYDGPLSDWSPDMYMYSPNLYVSDNTLSWYCGWCGGDTVTTHNDLYWTLENNHLKIDCATNSWETNPSAQLITTYNWDKTKVKLLTIEHVDTIAAYKFQEYTNLETLQINSGVKIIGQFGFNGCTKLNTVYLPSSVTKIANGAFRNCGSLHNLYFDGTDEQWNHDMTRAENWNDYVADDFQAHWHCTVTFDANGHGTAPAPQSIEWSNQDKATEPTAPTADGYYFTGWYTDAECSTPWFFDDIVPGDMTLYAGWNPETVTVLGDVNGDGSVTSADVTCLYNYLLNGDETFIATSDVNNDGFITSADITVIYNILLGSN